MSDDPRENQGPTGSEELFRFMVESVRDYAIFAISPEGRIVSWNTGAELIFGYREEEAVGRGADIIFTREDRERGAPEEELRKAAAEGRAEDERWHLRRDGTRFWASGMVTPLLDREGDLRGFVKVARDQTKRKLAEETRLRLAAIVELSDDAIISKDLTGRITSWNAGAEQVFGYTEAEAVGRPVTIIIPPELREEEEGIMRRLRAGGRIEHFETVRVDKQGRRIDVSLSISPIKDAEGLIVGASKIARDISERKRAEEERLRLLENERRARAEAEAAQRRAAFLAESSAVLSSSLDYQTTVASVARMVVPDLADWCRVDLLDEKGAIRRLAVAHSDSSKVKWADELERRYPTDPEAERGVPHVLRTGESELYTDIPEEMLAQAAKDDEHLRVMREVGFTSAMIVPLTARGRTVGAVSLISAESGRRYGPEDLAFAEELARRCALAIDNARLYGEAQAARAAAEQANRTKDDFLATLSHELRTPLTSILGWARMLTTTRLDAENTARALESIERNARAQGRLIDDILDVSRIITGKLRLDVRPVDLASVIEGAVESVRPAAEAKGIRLQRVLDTGPQVVSGDPERLQQVVWNLLSNAVKFTPKGGRVQVRLERINSHVEIVVSDTGRGINADVLPHVFERFLQADSSTAREHGGLGLGLAIVRHLAELHGGTVRAESAGEGQGATFTLDLPLMIVRPPQTAVAREEERVHPTADTDEQLVCPPELEGLHVLFVDDEEDARALLTTILESCGARVTAVGSAREALDELGREKFDVLLSDIGMPGEDGYWLIKKVRKLPTERGGQIRAAALTAYARAKDRLRVLRSGYQMHVPKPVEPAELVAVVANLAGRHEEN
ncbi:MAG: PAS domain S-box protein [Acidobacteriota bacterium]|nr:PAS domain S-box protein [Acidobacteriota bacterium]